MTKNEGVADRVVRVLVGAGVLSLAFVGPQTAWGYIGLVPLLTGLAGWCPAYTLFGISTCPMKPKRNILSGCSISGSGLAGDPAGPVSSGGPTRL